MTFFCVVRIFRGQHTAVVESLCRHRFCIRPGECVHKMRNLRQGTSGRLGNLSPGAETTVSPLRDGVVFRCDYYCRAFRSTSRCRDGIDRPTAEAKPETKNQADD